MAVEGGLAVGVDIVDGRGLRQPGQEGGLRQGQLVGGGVEIGLGGGLDAVGQVAVIDLVQVQLEDLVFG